MREGVRRGNPMDPLDPNHYHNDQHVFRPIDDIPKPRKPMLPLDRHHYCNDQHVFRPIDYTLNTTAPSECGSGTTILPSPSESDYDAGRELWGDGQNKTISQASQAYSPTGSSLPHQHPVPSIPLSYAHSGTDEHTIQNPPWGSPFNRSQDSPCPGAQNWPQAQNPRPPPGHHLSHYEDTPGEKSRHRSKFRAPGTRPSSPELEHKERTRASQRPWPKASPPDETRRSNRSGRARRQTSDDERFEEKSGKGRGRTSDTKHQGIYVEEQGEGQRTRRNRKPKNDYDRPEFYGQSKDDGDRPEYYGQSKDGRGPARFYAQYSTYSDEDGSHGE